MNNKQSMTNTPAISQSLIKEVMKGDHCPKQIMYAFLEGKELLHPSDNMLLGRYFESELLGSCRGGEVQEAKTLKKGEKATAYKECDTLVQFAKDVFAKLGLDVERGVSQVELTKDGISGNIDHINKDISSDKKAAIYDVKWTATKEDDRWNGWGDPESKEEAHLQAVHYVLVYHKIHGVYPPFYFLVFGKDMWVKVIKVNITPERLDHHKNIIAHTASVIREYAENDYKGNGSFNKCLACPFYAECEDKATTPTIDTITI